MWNLVIITDEREEIVYTAEDRRLVELRKEMHIRSMAPGFAEIRKAEDQTVFFIPVHSGTRLSGESGRTMRPFFMGYGKVKR